MDWEFFVYVLCGGIFVDYINFVFLIKVYIVFLIKVYI